MCLCNCFQVKKDLPKLISDTQLGLWKGDISESVEGLKCDIREKCDENEIPGLLMLSVEWNFIS